MQKIKRPSTSDGKKRVKIAGTEFVVDEKYEIIKQIGSGAYGVVVSALDTTTNKKYAIKKVPQFLLRSSTPSKTSSTPNVS